MSRNPNHLEWWCRLALRALAASFAIVGTIFLFAPDATLDFMNAAGSTLGDFTPAPRSVLRFWLSLATGYMVLVTALAYLAQRDLRRHRDLLLLLALGKATSSLTCLVFYLWSLDAFIYLANFLVDGSIAVTALAIWVAVPSLPHVTVVDSPPARSRAAFDSILEAMVPAGGAFAEGGRDATNARDIEAFVAGAGASAKRALQVGLQIFDASPYFLPPLKWHRFSQLPLDERVRILESWEQSSLPPRRLAMHILKLLVMTHVYSHPTIEARLGYPHPLERVPRPEAAS